MRPTIVLICICLSSSIQIGCAAAAAPRVRTEPTSASAVGGAGERVQAVAVQLGAGRLNRQFPNELDDRLYLRHVPVDPRGLTRFAGGVLNFYGEVHPDGSCTPDTTRAPSLEVRNYLRDSAQVQVELLSILKYQSILDRTAAGSGSFVIANLALRDSQLAEVIVEDIAKIEAITALDHDAIRQIQQDTLPLGICRRTVIAAAYLTSVKARVYRQIGGQGVVTGMGFGLDGKFFVSNSDFGSNLLLSVDSRLIRERRLPPRGGHGDHSTRLLIFPAPVLAHSLPSETTESRTHTSPD